VSYYPHHAEIGRVRGALLQEYGVKGYGIYDLIMSEICQQPGMYFCTRKPGELRVFAGKCRVPTEEVLQVIELLVEIAVIDKELWEKHGVIWSEALVESVRDAFRKRMDAYPIKPSLETFEEKQPDERSQVTNDGNDGKGGDLSADTRQDDKNTEYQRVNGGRNRERESESENKEVKNNDSSASAPAGNKKSIHERSGATAKYSQADSRADEIVVWIPLKDGTEYGVTRSLADEYAVAYPDLDVVAELAQARSWGLSNEQKQKTRSGVKAHLNSWLLNANTKKKPASTPAPVNIPACGNGMNRKAPPIEEQLKTNPVLRMTRKASWAHLPDGKFQKVLPDGTLGEIVDSITTQIESEGDKQ
jgi:hypothetical protein